MLPPLQDNVVVATRRIREYEFTAAGQVCARTRMRAATARQTLGWFWRLLGGRSAMRHMELEVCDEQGVAHWLIVLEASRGTDLRAHAALLDGTPLGNAVSSGGMFTLHRPIDLYDAAGAPIGRVVTGAVPEVFNSAGEHAAVFQRNVPFTFGEDPGWSLHFTDHTMSIPARATVLAAIVALDLPR